MEMRKALFLRFLSDTLRCLVVLRSALFEGVVDSLCYTEGDADADEIQRKPEGSVKQYMSRIPNPFKQKRQHGISSSNRIYPSTGFNAFS